MNDVTTSPPTPKGLHITARGCIPRRGRNPWYRADTVPNPEGVQ